MTEQELTTLWALNQTLQTLQKNTTVAFQQWKSRFFPNYLGIFSSSIGGGDLVAKSCPTLCDPMECSPPRSSILRISQARILEWVAISFSKGSSRPRDQTCVSCLAGRLFTTEPPGKSSSSISVMLQNKCFCLPPFIY